MKKNLHQQIRGMLEDKSDKLNLISGELGIKISGQKTVEVSGRDGYVWVRLRGSESELIQAYNASVSPIYDLPVLLTRQGNKYSVYGRDIERYENWGNTPYLPRHGAQHSFAPELGMGGDVTWIYSRQFVPLLPSPSGTSGAGLLNINPHVYRTPQGTWEYVGNKSTPNILLAKPVDSQARMMLLYWDLDTSDSALLTGTSFSASITGTASVLPYIPSITDSRKIPIAGIRLVSGTSVIGWDNIYDVRQFATNTPPSFNGGFGIMDEGIIQGTGTIINFIGDGVTAIVSGSIARVHINGGGSGDSLWMTGSAGAYSITTIDGSNDSTATNALSHGVANLASGNSSHAEGDNSTSAGSSSHAEGSNTISFGTASHAEGSNTIASGSFSHAEGVGNIAVGYGSHAAGGENIVGGVYSASVAGVFHIVSGSNSSVLSGDSINAFEEDVAYTDRFNIKRLYSGTAIANVGIDSRGFLVTGTVSTGSVGGDSYWKAGSAGTGSITTVLGNNDSTKNWATSFGLGNRAAGIASFAVGADNSVSGSFSGVHGYLNSVLGDASAIVAGQTNRLIGTNSSIISGNGITGSADNTAYMGFANVQQLGGGTPVSSVGRDANGFLVTGTAAAAETQSNDIFRCDSPGGEALFGGTINGAPSGATVVYTPSTGYEGALVPYSTSQIGKLRLYNTTRGNYALILNCNTGTNTITLTANAPAGWANGDSITITSQTVSSENWIDIELQSPLTGYKNMFIKGLIGAASGNVQLRVHPFETFASSKLDFVSTQVATTGSTRLFLLKINSNVITMRWTADVYYVAIREAGYM